MSKDHNSVIAVFGDHGSWNYRGVPDTGDSRVSSAMVELDRYGVTFAIYPEEVCSGVFKDRYEIKFLFKDLLNCGALQNDIQQRVVPDSRNRSSH
jgi:hypothetical protein